MQTIGLLGGMSWESSVLYEELINTEVRGRLGGMHSADLLLRSYDFAEITALQAASDWDGAGQLLAADAKKLESGGAEIIALCSNTMHRVAPAIQDALDVPFIHICDALAAEVKAQGLSSVGLIGTQFTMEPGFYREWLEGAGLSVIVPSEEEQLMIHKVIYDELAQGVLNRSSHEDFLDVIDRLGAAGAEGVISGCAEIELLVSGDDVFVPYFASTEVHSRAIVEASLA